MKSISVTLETLSSGNFRATVRHSGTTVAYKDGTDAKSLVADIMAKTCGAHRTESGYDLTCIDMNSAALASQK